MITTGRLIEIATSVSSYCHNTRDDRAALFVCALIGELRHTEGMERANELAAALGFSHLVKHPVTPP